MQRADHSEYSRYEARINRAQDFIVARLAEKWGLSDIAAASGFSAFHFHRVFLAATGETLHAYTTRLRLERALFLMLRRADKSLSSIALECGFQSSSNFSRCFRAAFAASPSQLGRGARLQHWLDERRKAAAPERLAPKAQADDLDTDKPTVRIAHWSKSTLVYARAVGGYLRPEKLITAYQRLQAWADSQHLDRSRARLIGMSMDDPAIVPLQKCRYDFCYEVQAHTVAPVRLSTQRLPAGDWAIARCVGDLAQVDRTWTALFSHWLPRSGFQPAARPAIEVFHRRPEEIGWDQFDLDCCLPVEPFAP